MRLKISFATPEARLARWRRIQNAGFLRFFFTRGLLFAVVFGLTVCVISRPSKPWYLFVLTVLIVSFAWAAAMWVVTMWQYRRAQKEGQAQ